MQEFASTIEQQKTKVARIKIDYDSLTEEQKKLIEQGTKYAKSVAEIMFCYFKKRKTEFISELTIDDFIAWGYEGLTEAAKNFDNSLGFDFKITYADKIIKGRILDHLRELNSITRGHLEFLQEYDEVIELVKKELGLEREPTEEEIAKKMGLTLEQYRKKLIKFPINTGIETLEYRQDKSGNYLSDVQMQKENLNSLDIIEEKEKKTELLDKFLTKLELEERDRRILELYFKEGFTHKKIAKELKLSESSVERIKNNTVKQLRELFEQQGYEVSDVNKQFIHPKKK